MGYLGSSWWAAFLGLQGTWGVVTQRPWGLLRGPAAGVAGVAGVARVAGQVGQAMRLQGAYWGPGEWGCSRRSVSSPGVRGSGGPRGPGRLGQGLMLTAAAVGAGSVGWVAWSLGCSGEPVGLGCSSHGAR